MVWGAIASVFAATLIWHFADVRMLHAFELGQRTQGYLWVLVHILSVPLFALSSFLFFRVQRSWWIVELPYLLMGLLISSFLFRNILKVAITWREGVAAMLIIIAAYLVATANPEASTAPIEGAAGSAIDLPHHQRSDDSFN